MCFLLHRLSPLDAGSIFVRYIAAEVAKDRELEAFLKAMAAVPFERPVVAEFIQAILTGLKA
jgi:hypothetical protein